MIFKLKLIKPNINLYVIMKDMIDNKYCITNRLVVDNYLKDIECFQLSWTKEDTWFNHYNYLISCGIAETRIKTINH